MISDEDMHAAVRRLLDYDPATGIMIWKDGQFKGTVAGRSRLFGQNRSKPRSYWVISIFGRPYPRSRLIYLWMMGRWPPGEMDHLNRDSLDDRWINLRAVTRGENQKNTSLYDNNKLRIRGVHMQRGKFRAMVSIDGKNHHIGYFDTEEAAKTAWERARRAA